MIIHSKTNFAVKDHSVSGEKFMLRYDGKYDMYHTEPKPSLGNLSAYYASEEYISHTDGGKSLVDRLYRFVKSSMLQKKMKLIHKRNNGGHLLDIGAGTGDFLAAAKSKHWEICGVEPNPKARRLAKEKGISLSENLETLNVNYEVITMWHVLEHVFDLDYYLDFLKNHLAKEGTLYVAVPNFKSDDAIKYKHFWAAYDVPRHLYHFSETSIKKLFEEKGMELIDTMPLLFDSYYVSLLSEKYKKSSLAPIKAFLSGWYSNRKARKSGEYSSKIYIIQHKKKI